MKKRNVGSDFDDFLAEEGMLEDVTAVAVKRVIAGRGALGGPGVYSSASTSSRSRGSHTIMNAWAWKLSPS